MKRFSWLIVLAVVAVLALSLIGSYNRMVSLTQNVDGAWAQVNTQLQSRYDLIPNLVETVKGYAAHEQQAISAVTEARAAMMGATSAAEQQTAANQLESALGRLFVIVENYPQLKADTVFIGLQDELAGTERRIAVQRMDFNDRVREYNTYIARFPAVLMAKMFGFEQRAYFETTAGADQVPQVNFGN
jgi:LemA protein